MGITYIRAKIYFPVHSAPRMKKKKKTTQQQQQQKSTNSSAAKPSTTTFLFTWRGSFGAHIIRVHTALRSTKKSKKQQRSKFLTFHFSLREVPTAALHHIHQS